MESVGGRRALNLGQASLRSDELLALVIPTGFGEIRVQTLKQATVSKANPESLLVGEHAHDSTDDLDGSGWHGTINYAGFSRPMWSWLRGPEFDAEFLGVPDRVSVRPATSVVETMKDFKSTSSRQPAVHSMSLPGYAVRVRRR